METNETILTRKAVGLDDRKVLGKVGDLRVDCDTLGVCHYIVNSASTNSSLVLPFEKALAVGDTFLTVQSRGEFLPVSDEAVGIVNDGFKLVGVEAYSKTGNKLGVVASYGFDPVFGTVTELVLDSGATFAADRFVFFAPEFVFVDDGEQTAVELRSADAGAVSAPETETDPEEPSTADEQPAVEDAAEDAGADEDAELIAFLLGQTTVENVASSDGAFTVERGTVLTQEIIDEARAHDALLLLTMSVDA